MKYLTDNENFNFIKIPSSPLIKKNTFKFIFSILMILFSTLKSIKFLFKHKPLAVFGMGGYASFPVCIAAAILRIKLVIYENNLIIGKTNKYLLPFVDKIFVSYKDLEGISKKNSKKIIEIGNIIREEIINLNFKKKNFETIKILVLGGSQAAKIFAEKLPQIFKKINDTGISIKIIQQCQPTQNEELSQFYKKQNIDFEIFNFTNDVIDYYSKADLAITRSGASTSGELINTQTPFIAIPLPKSADNHQFKNAQYYEKKGFGYLLEEKNISDKLYDLIVSIYKDKTIMEKIIFNQSQHSDKDIFKKLNMNIKKILNEKN